MAAIFLNLLPREKTHIAFFKIFNNFDLQNVTKNSTERVSIYFIQLCPLITTYTTIAHYQNQKWTLAQYHDDSTNFYIYSYVCVCACNIRLVLKIQ